MTGVLSILLPIVMLAVLVVLGIGVFGMIKGSDFNRKHANRLMQWRVLLQAVAVGLLGLMFLLGRH